MKDLYRKYFKTPQQKRGGKAIDDILESFNTLITDENFEAITTRDIIKKSGYSNGSIYRYFRKIDNIFLTQFIAKVKQGTKESIDFINNFKPQDNFQKFAEEIIDLGFSHWKSPVKQSIIRVMLRYFLRNSDSPEMLNSLQDPIIPHILEAQKRDLSGTFRQMEENELRLCIRGLQAAIRSPFIENQAHAGSKEHRDIAIRIAVAIFSK